TWTTGALEGRYHCAAATSLAFTARLHQVQRGSAPHPHPPFVLSDAALRSHRIFPKKEQIDAFWSIVILNNYWVAASSLPSSIPCDTSIGTPWPSITLRRAPPSSERGGGRASHDALIQASILLERTISFAAHNPAPLPRVPHSRPATEFFRARLAPAPPTDTRALVTHALVNVALIRLHGYGPNCLSAAGCVVAQLQNTHFSDWDRVDPILAAPIRRRRRLHRAPHPPHRRLKHDAIGGPKHGVIQPICPRARECPRPFSAAVPDDARGSLGV
ncbi:hypothetical protein B0H17DRAFT_1188657, partial [Mycena rosella]